MAMRRPDRLTLFWLALCLPPLLTVLWAQASYAVDVPFEDDIWLTPVVELPSSGWRDAGAVLTEQRMESRFVTMRAAFALLAWAKGGWDYGAQRALIVLAAGLNAVMVCRIGGRALRAKGIDPRPLWPCVAVLAFSLTQWKIWGKPYTLNVLLTSLFLLLATDALAARKPTLRRIAGAACAAALCSLSFIYGFLVWPLLLPLVLAAGTRAAALWLAAGAATAGLYLVGYDPGTAGGALTDGLRLRYTVRQTLGVMGNPLLPYQYYMTMAAGLALPLACGAALLKRRRDRSVLALALLVAFGIATALLAALGRSAADGDYPSRYVGMLFPAVAALPFLLGSLPGTRRAAYAAGAWLVLMHVAAARPALRTWSDVSAQLERGKACLEERTSDDACIGLLHLGYPDPHREMLPRLIRLGAAESR